jgi:predicted HTH transcriptional regulator
VTWEAKADDDEERKRPEGEEPGRLRATTIRKGACAFANQIGGYLILGARWDKRERRWRMAGFVPPEPEAKTWLSNVLDGLRPVPRYDLKAWALNGQRVVAVVQVEPVDVAPCMTPQGHVYERVSGKSVRVTDPVLLDALFRRGREARERADGSAQTILWGNPIRRSRTWRIRLSHSFTPGPERLAAIRTAYIGRG